MALLPHKYLLPDLNSCPSLNQEKRSTLHHHSRKPTTWFHQNIGNLKLFSFRFSVYPLKKKRKKQILLYLNDVSGTFLMISNLF